MCVFYSAWKTVDLQGAWKRVNDATLVPIVEQHGSVVESFHLEQCFGLSDEALKTIATHCPKLRKIVLTGCWYEYLCFGSACPFCTKYISYLTNTLCVLYRAITDSGVKVLATHLPDLRVVDLSSCRKLTDLAVVGLTNQCINLVSLKLEYCKNLTDVALKYILARCRLLQTLNLKRCTSLSNGMLLFRLVVGVIVHILSEISCKGISQLRHKPSQICEK